MPRTYKRKTNWGSTPLEALERAANDVKAGRSIRSVATERKIDTCTLRRYIKKREVKEVKVAGYSGTAEARRVFSGEMEKELADHIKKLADQFHGLTPKKCHELSLELAIRNNIPTPSNWREKGLASRKCKKQHHSVGWHRPLAVRNPPLHSRKMMRHLSHGINLLKAKSFPSI
uniref:Zgc:113274 n=1 Tax=Seriola dumerili TaxID=41447 RepID=A0A3B4T3S7_SERDU